MATDYGTQEKKKSRRRIVTILLVVVIIIGVLLALSFTGTGSSPSTPDQKAAYAGLNFMIDYYNPTMGLIPTGPGSTNYSVYPDNYVAGLALSRFQPTNSTMVDLAEVLNVTAISFQDTLPTSALVSQYAALNSTQTGFGCEQSYTMSWGAGQSKAYATLTATLNTGNATCSALTADNAEIDFLQAIYYQKLGDSSQAMTFYAAGAKDFDGTGLADAAFGNSTSSSYHQYQTSSLSMYIFAAVCLSQTATDKNYPALEPALIRLQDNSTGGFYPYYGSGFNTLGSQPNTLATSLAVLALEQEGASPGTC